MPVGFESFNRFDKETTRLKQLYDITVHLYGQEHERVAEKLKDADPFETMHTDTRTIAHNLNQLYEHTRSFYPERLRELLLISLITLTEGYLADLAKEVFQRKLDPFKTSGDVKFPKGQVLSMSSIDEVHEKIVEREQRSLTSGGLSDTAKYYRRRFDIDFNGLSVDLKEVKEIHERRHLHVHNGGICDGRYARQFDTRYNPGERIPVGHDYFMDSVNTITDFAEGVASECKKRFPKKERGKEVVFGERSRPEDDEQILLVRMEISENEFDFPDDLTGLRISFADEPDRELKYFTYQIVREEKRCILVIGGTRKQVGRTVQTVKMNDYLTFRMATDLILHK
jgi:hypothetical protein